MEKHEILSNLCYHDKRNPNYDMGMDGLDSADAIGGGKCVSVIIVSMEGLN